MEHLGEIFPKAGVVVPKRSLSCLLDYTLVFKTGKKKKKKKKRRMIGLTYLLVDPQGGTHAVPALRK